MKEKVKVQQIFVPTPLSLADGKPVSYGAVCLYMIYYSYADWKNTEKPIFVEQQRLAERLRTTTDQISSWQSELEREGWLTVRRTGRANAITLRVVRLKKRKK